MKNLIAFVGFKSSGKNTAAEALYPLGYTPFSFADGLKDAVAAIFCWDRQLLEGITDESRIWREQVDEWWANKLGIPHFTPRWMMQNFGTEIMRKSFNDDIWILNVEKRMLSVDSAVITDCRFPNEIKMIKSHNGKVIRIKRGADPKWFETARLANMAKSPLSAAEVFAIKDMRELNIHPSECAWIGQDFFMTVFNDSTIEKLHAKIKVLEKAPLSS